MNLVTKFDPYRRWMGKVIDQWMCYKGVRGNREGVEDYFEGEGRLGFWGKWARMGVHAGPEFRN